MFNSDHVPFQAFLQQWWILRRHDTDSNVQIFHSSIARWKFHKIDFDFSDYKIEQMSTNIAPSLTQLESRYKNGIRLSQVKITVCLFTTGNISLLALKCLCALMRDSEDVATLQFCCIAYHMQTLLVAFHSTPIFPDWRRKNTLQFSYWDIYHCNKLLKLVGQHQQKCP